MPELKVASCWKTSIKVFVFEPGYYIEVDGIVFELQRRELTENQDGYVRIQNLRYGSQFGEMGISGTGEREDDWFGYRWTGAGIPRDGSSLPPELIPNTASWGEAFPPAIEFSPHAKEKSD